MRVECRSNDERIVIAEICEGMVPQMLLLANDRVLRLVNVPMVVGNSNASALLSRRSVVSEIMLLPISVGMDP